jgi:hypothetical protein
MLFDESGDVFNERIDVTIQLHKEFEVFAKRPLVTFLVSQFSHVFSVTIGLAFIIVNAILLMLSGVVLYHLSLLNNPNRLYASINTIFYFSSFTVLFGFFDPIYSYDEPLQYFLLFSAFYFYLKKRMLFFIIFMSLAIITRESSMLLLPAIFLFWDGKMEFSVLFKKESIKKALILSIPILIYIGFVTWYVSFAEIQESGETGMIDRYDNFRKNFIDQLTAVESLVSFFLVLGLVSYFFLMKNWQRNSSEKHVESAFLMTVILNSSIVFLFTFAREARLFALPLIFVWPYFTVLFKEQLKIYKDFKLIKQALINWKFIGVLFFILGLNYIIAYKTFYSLYYLREANHFLDYFFIVLSLISFHFLLSRFKARKQEMLITE